MAARRRLALGRFAGLASAGLMSPSSPSESASFPPLQAATGHASAAPVLLNSLASILALSFTDLVAAPCGSWANQAHWRERVDVECVDMGEV